VGEYEIGSEAWVRERIEQGLDPGEGDRPDDAGLRIELAGVIGQPKDTYPAWNVPTSFTV
jgi:hypothetical protein